MGSIVNIPIDSHYYHVHEYSISLDPNHTELYYVLI